MTRQFVTPEIYSAPSTSLAQTPVIAADICTGCEKCIPVCPENAITMQADKAVIHPERCTNCKLCIPVCPSGAIHE
ncbi:4Fe-4S binding protein [candidate division KSB1 bacterium]|nr:4Fe-4S binding protein [candidate division KSB1 bacterium]